MPESNAESPKGAGEKPWQFKKGQSGNPGGKPKSGAVKPAEILRDMRRVYRQEEKKDRTPGEKLCRRWLKDNPKEFLSHLARYEAEEEAEQARREPEPEEDERQEKVGALIDRILDDCNKEQAREDAMLAKRPDAAEIGGTLQKRLTEALEREERLRKRVEELERGPTSPNS